MKKLIIITGLLFILASAGFWLGWFLMPDPGTTDTNHILTIVKQARTAVFSSVIIQVTSSVLYVVALALLTKICFPRNTTLAGIALMLVGAMGMCADAFFHLLAWFMTDESINRGEDIVRVMYFMQTDGVVFLLPIMLPFFIGGPILAWGLFKQSYVSRRPFRVAGTAFMVAVAAVLFNEVAGFDGSGQELAPLALFSVAMALIGFELIKAVTVSTRGRQQNFLLTKI